MTEDKEYLSHMAMTHYHNKLAVGQTLVAPTMTGTITKIEYVETHHTHQVTVTLATGEQTIGYVQLDKLIDSGKIEVK